MAQASGSYLTRPKANPSTARYAMRAMPNTIQRLPGPQAATAGPAWNLHQPRPDPAPARQGPLELSEGGKDSGPYSIVVRGCIEWCRLRNKERK